MGELFGAGIDLPYSQRVQRLTECGVAVWDVAHQAHRPGSLDSAIDRASLVANDFGALFAAHPTLRTVAFNGRAAAELFRRHALPKLPSTLALRLHDLPSTSPANAGFTRAQKLDAWSKLLSK